VVFAQAAVLRAHKTDPFMALSVLNAAATALLALLLIPGYGVAGAVAAYALATALIALGGGTFIFMRMRSLWWLNDARP
jgi:O-antigen/teichoic acid export membrane protein